MASAAKILKRFNCAIGMPKQGYSRAGKVVVYMPDHLGLRIDASGPHVVPSGVEDGERAITVSYEPVTPMQAPYRPRTDGNVRQN